MRKQTAKADTLHVDNDTSDEKEIAQRNATFKACRRKLHKAIRAREWNLSKELCETDLNP